ncbi:prevent-host-death family protein [Achromobacter sp. GG226]|uniref:hypothetical protein n=1 Tax=Verticiella alkaliphila TaxID=2779529 RepID=UPI001C0CCC8D|nr:hypothetical protein [Verticiella sp. GG226]MBU4610126.1 prevent-host-death family protein [Verticiella sp. GG226]
MTLAASSVRHTTLERLPSISASRLVAGMQKASRDVLTHGAIVVTKHDEPAMVLMSVERYLALEHAAEPDLDALTQQFDALYARLQTPQAADRLAAAFAMDPDELGEVAQRAAVTGR